MAALGYRSEVDPSKAKPPQPRKNTRGDFVVPNSLVENLALLTHAETAFMLIVLRRGGKSEGCVISDRNWQSWTGLKARAKEYAIKGLKDKGLRVLGRGDKAVYSVALSQWSSFVLKATPPEVAKPRTAGRAVSAPLDMKVHPDCAAGGCSKLCESCEISTDSVGNLIPFAQPVAQTNAQPVAQTDGQNLSPCAKFLPGVKGAFCVACGFNRSAHKGHFAQPVAQISSKRGRAIAQPVARPKTLQAIRSHGFVTAGQAFIELLAKAIMNGAGFVPADDDLVGLVHRAKALKGKSQRSEGLFLSTVPPVVAAWLDERDRAAGVAVSERIGDQANFDALILDLEDLARRDVRFSDAVARAIKKLKAQDWRGLNVKDIFSIIDKIKAEIERLSIDFYMTTAEAASHDSRIREAAKNLKLTDRQMDDHVLLNIEFYAFESLGVPFQWVRWISDSFLFVSS